MSAFKVENPTAKQEVVHEDRRSFIEKMFYDYDAALGELVPLPIYPLDGNDDWKRYTDCIPLVKRFAADNPAYTGPLKGKDVLVLGGRRKGRAGTGVELMLPVEDIDKFCELAQVVAKSALEAD